MCGNSGGEKRDASETIASRDDNFYPKFIFGSPLRCQHHYCN